MRKAASGLVTGVDYPHTPARLSAPTASRARRRRHGLAIHETLYRQNPAATKLGIGDSVPSRETAVGLRVREEQKPGRGLGHLIAGYDTFLSLEARDDVEGEGTVKTSTLVRIAVCAVLMPSLPTLAVAGNEGARSSSAQDECEPSKKFSIKTDLKAGINAIELRLHDDALRKVPHVAVVSALGNEVARATCVADSEQCIVFLPRSLSAEDIVEVRLLGADGKAQSDAECSEKPVRLEGSFNWGRVRGEFTGGVVLSKENGEFSKTDPVFAATVLVNWLPVTHKSRWSGFTYVDVRLTSVNTPTTQMDMNAGETTGSPESRMAPAGEGENGNGEGGGSFDDQPKAGVIEMGIYFPLRLSGWSYGGKENSLFVAPLGKVGQETIREDVAVTMNDDLFSFIGAGVRIGHHQGGTSGSMPGLLSYVDIVGGRWSRFDPEGRQKWRLSVDGQIQIPGGLAVGATLNIGSGRDDFRLLVTKTVDLGVVLKPLLE